jgi:hypothetical protein
MVGGHSYPSSDVNRCGRGDRIVETASDDRAGLEDLEGMACANDDELSFDART